MNQEVKHAHVVRIQIDKQLYESPDADDRRGALPACPRPGRSAALQGGTRP